MQPSCMWLCPSNSTATHTPLTSQQTTPSPTVARVSFASTTPNAQLLSVILRVSALTTLTLSTSQLPPQLFPMKRKSLPLRHITVTTPHHTTTTLTTDSHTHTTTSTVITTTQAHPSQVAPSLVSLWAASSSCSLVSHAACVHPETDATSAWSCSETASYRHRYLNPTTLSPSPTTTGPD